MEGSGDGGGNYREREGHCFHCHDNKVTPGESGPPGRILPGCSAGLERKKRPLIRKRVSNLSSGASPALSTSPSRVLVLLGGRASLQVDFQHRLIHKLGGTVRTHCWLLICNGPEAAFRLMQQRRRG